MEWGMQTSHEKKLWIGTEASTKGIGLYRKMGFEQVGVWNIAEFEIPVMKLAVI
jgi:hypothetical protein